MKHLQILQVNHAWHVLLVSMEMEDLHVSPVILIVIFVLVQRLMIAQNVSTVIICMEIQ